VSHGSSAIARFLVNIGLMLNQLFYQSSVDRCCSISFADCLSFITIMSFKFFTVRSLACSMFCMLATLAAIFLQLLQLSCHSENNSYMQLG